MHQDLHISKDRVWILAFIFAVCGLVLLDMEEMGMSIISVGMCCDRSYN
jgi:hypothetical protein